MPKCIPKIMIVNTPLIRPPQILSPKFIRRTFGWFGGGYVENDG